MQKAFVPPRISRLLRRFQSWLSPRGYRPERRYMRG
jgi:hypothetical protein